MLIPYYDRDPQTTSDQDLTSRHRYINCYTCYKPTLSPVDFSLVIADTDITSAGDLGEYSDSPSWQMKTWRYANIFDRRRGA